MCLILLAWKSHPEFPLVVAANRDEYFARPSRPVHFWPEAPQLLAGRDLEAGGTWLGLTTSGRFAAVTNYRDPSRNESGRCSRGGLVADYLRRSIDPASYVHEIDGIGAHYNGFNLLCGDMQQMHYVSNCGGPPRQLEPGIYGLSNHLLDTPWPKVAQAKSVFSKVLDVLPDTAPLFALLSDDKHAADACLPATGVSLEWERLLSAAFVRSPDYGTRSSTVIVRTSDGSGWVEEHSFGPGARPIGTVRCEFTPTPSSA